MTKKQIRQAIIFLTLTLSLFIVSVVSAFLLFEDENIKNITIGEVDVRIDSYFYKDNEKYTLDETNSNNGVATLNISENNKSNFFDNFRVDIKIYSSVDTYFRLTLYEQFTLSYESGGNLNEVAVTRDEYSEFMFNEDFYDNREFDDYFYYKNKVKRINENEPLIISFIMENIDYNHPIYDPKYTINVGILVEAVQALKGPNFNWGLNTRPWDDNEW